MAVVFTDQDLGFDRLLRIIEDGARVTVGIQQEQAELRDKNGGITVLGKAIANEFGASRIPARSFLRSTMDEKEAKYTKLTGRLLKKAIAGVLTVDQALAQLGLVMVGDVQKKITTLKTPPNKKSTIRRKKSANPLIDSGQLRQSIRSKVEDL